MTLLAMFSTSSNTVDSFGYSINYYKGSIADENLVETVHNPADLRPFGSTVELRVDEMNMHRPNGYAEVSNARNLTITADAANNIINVVFAPDFGESTRPASIPS